MNEIKKIEGCYKNRVVELEEYLAVTKTKNFRFSLLRLGSFVLMAFLAAFLFQLYWWVGVIGIYLFAIVFYRIVVIHRKIGRKLGILEKMIQLNKDEIRITQNDLSAFPSGDLYMDNKHPYSSDVDIFGNNSLYRKMNRTNSLPGSDLLAVLLKEGLPKGQLEEYQLACKELEPQLEFRQRLFAEGQMDFNHKMAYERFNSWLKDKGLLKRNRLVQFGLPIIGWLAFVFLLNLLPWHLALLAFVPTAVFSILHRKKVDHVHMGLSFFEKHLKIYGRALRLLEQQSFRSPLLASTVDLLNNPKNRASDCIDEAAYILSQLNIRYNVFGILFDLVTLWDFYWASRLETWKERYADSFLEWMDGLARFEALNSLSTFAYNHPHGHYPVFEDCEVIIGTDLQHPLIHSDNCIPNDLHLPLNGHITIITGSNMGGKTTYLRTCAINMVLARCGTKICGQSLVMPYVIPFTSMRNEDALHESTSSFYAELKRLGQVIDAVEKKEAVVFFLDEILKGTNSLDRHTGAKALIKQLLKNGGSGMLSTHDLELGVWAQEFSDQIRNICFEVDVVNGRLSFDYRVKEGISKSFNATQLMRQSGIEI